ncbi:dihydrodipicolinate synthase family protein [Mesorhizobium sp. YC-39]|uniref:dihydrodipicolinate synthase family protein n=1 Tax=unclassified Mesorhizobium TaxID=325217 RepID=UPI0021E7B603|nr:MULTISPECIES: dihydrodipicolinate synthase family protein [unclassified Mesorhizobium]MCV3209413.1 dihydrodipicolinate synthase family protein [Mesorhizobium sp. YC-2]MCV3231237.1 dihydrodipicolinate synthase family protein [Mesorhizobium sp. YC-39]
MTSKLRGVIAAIPTPFTRTLEPDIDRFVSLAGRLLDEGCDALNMCGTTGEATSMSLAQRKALMSAAAKALPRDRLMVGTGAASVADAIELTRHAGELGLAGALLLPPFYYKNVGDDGVIAYFGAVAQMTAAQATPLYLYHFPALSGVPFHPALVAALRERIGPRLSGLKDSSGDLAYSRTVAAADFDVFPSDEGSLMEARSGTFAGCISATANLSSRLCAAAWRDGDAGALATASAIRKRVASGPLIPGIKAMVAEMMADPAYASPLPPLTALPAAESEKLKHDLKGILGRDIGF